ncbi:hypothetical protein Hypma_015424 [Hypsizygus marmoreus]|uniref:Uncharacterized protein n=1 Tax=Hypsizygus marmoreus TaxID=39966 RepID=A0A369KF31_HYPMA|nr:hypothetical protein Hypma_015424 [Hypsizygus marmoreus]
MSNPTSSTPLLPRNLGGFPGPNVLWRTGAIFVSIGIMAGAFGAHGLKRRPGITPENLHAFQTASTYAVYNGLGLLLVSLHPRFSAHGFAGPAIAAGGVLFSGSIVALVLGGDRFKFLGPVTPLGGLITIAGYLSLALFALYISTTTVLLRPMSAAATSSSLPARPPKRRMPSQELDFFTPAATSFKPRPYTPHNASAASTSQPSLPIRHHNRPIEAHILPPAGMDPQPTDPSVLFIHPPFTTFPNSHIYSDGLSYQLMADNPEWFLDADDFVSQHNPNPHAIPYPPHLEPPRGWCPAKKKDLKDRGAEGWPEGEEPRLRCTFCRRTYAGVNAKSMWRRHVFEKHKIAMSNRRDGNERPRGRGANKENRQLASKPQPESHDSLVSMDVTPQTEFQGAPYKSKFRSLLPAAQDYRRRNAPKNDALIPVPSAPVIPQGEFPGPPEEARATRHHPLSRSHIPPLSPPLTPQSSMSSDPVHASVASDPLVATSSPLALPVVPPSPYDPLLTPSFRHSPPRLPSDQPWRFPSPSHPLHSRSRELSLSMLIRDLNSPLAKGSPVIGESPRMVQASPMPSPRVFGSTLSKRGLLDPDTPESLEKLPNPSPRALFGRGRLSVPCERMRYHIQESPVQRRSRTISRGHLRSDSELTDEWLSEVTLTTSASGLDTSELLTGGDPFVIMYSPWRSIGNSTPGPSKRRSSPTAGAGAESPVLRNSALPTGVGLGIGLLGPFILPDDSPHAGTDSDFDDGMLTYPTTEEEGDEAEVASFLAISTKSNIAAGVREKTPPLKKRRMTIENRE